MRANVANHESVIMRCAHGCYAELHGYWREWLEGAGITENNFAERIDISCELWYNVPLS